MKIYLPVLCFLLNSYSYGQTMQGTIKPGSTPRTIDIFLKPSASFSQKDEAMTLVLAIPANITPAPSVGSSGVTPNVLGPVTGITGLQPNFLIDNLRATQREVFVSTELINGASYFIYTFIFAGTASVNHSWTGDIEQQIFSIQFNGCTSNCNPMNELLVNLANGGTNSNSYWYFQPNTLGDITNYSSPFYGNPQSGTAVNGGSSDGSVLSTIGLASPVSLPIKLKSLNAKVDGCSINTLWEMSSEVNAAYYGIERSENAIIFHEIGRVTATTQNSFSKAYSFSDNNAPAGTLYYRLRMTSKDGVFDYSPVKEVNLNCSGKGNVFIYPALSKGQINVRLASGYENARIKVINSIGQEVASDEANNLFRSINLKGFANGTYVVQVFKNNKMTDNTKIVLAQ